MMRPHALRMLLVLGLLLCGTAAADSGASRGIALANACAACHGSDGRSQGAIPSIDSLAIEDSIAALRAFRAGARQGTVMNRIAKGLDDVDINAVATYFATQRKR